MSSRLLREADIITAMLENKEMFRTKKDIQRFAVIVGDIPAVDVELNLKLAYERGKADRPQGEWIVSCDDSICPICGKDEAEFIYGTEIWYGQGKSHFCPNCGAKMFAKDINVPTKKGADDE